MRALGLGGKGGGAQNCDSDSMWSDGITWRFFFKKKWGSTGGGLNKTWRIFSRWGSYRRGKNCWRVFLQCVAKWRGKGLVQAYCFAKSGFTSVRRRLVYVDVSCT